jgi:hypothetical protein
MLAGILGGKGSAKVPMWQRGGMEGDRAAGDCSPQVSRVGQSCAASGEITRVIGDG